MPGKDANIHEATALRSRTAEQVLAGSETGDAVAREIRHGNSDLIRALDMTGMAGPYRAVDPWRLEDLNDPDGEALINAGGYAALPFGERYPPLIDFARRYLGESSSMCLPQQAASEWRAELEFRLVEKLAEFAPSHSDSRVFFSNSGAEAIESAIKFAAHYRPRAPYFINFDRAYHGKTMGALSLTPNPHYQQQLRHMPLDVITLPFGDAQIFEDKIQRLGAKSVAAVVLEPVQGEAGIIVPEPEFLKKVDEICKRHGIVLVADEIQTGLGRSGHWFASVEWGGMDPDIITIAKPLGGGLTAIGATIARKAIFKKMLGGMNAKRQSNTFGGNSLAMAIALKSLDILEEEKLVERAGRLGERGRARLEKMAADYPDLIKEARQSGMLFAVQFQPVSPHKDIYPMEELNAELTGILALMMWRKAGVVANFSLNSSRSIRLTPPLTMPEPLFDEMFDRLESAAAEHPSSWRMFLGAPRRTIFNLSKFALFS